MDSLIRDIETDVKINIFLYREHQWKMYVNDSVRNKRKIKKFWNKISKQV